MANQDNKLGKAKDLGILNSSSFSKSDRIGSTDLDDLYRFSLSGRSRLDISLPRIAKDADVDIEVYALKRPFDKVKRSIGDIEFRNLRSSQRNSNLRLVGALKGKQTQNLFENLDQGDYLFRVLQGRKGNKGNSRYRFVLTSVSTSLLDAPPVTPPPVVPLTQPSVDNVNTANPITQADTIAPNANLNALIAPTKGSTTYAFTVIYRDNVGINFSSLNDNDIQVIGENGFTQSAKFLWGIDGTDGSLQARYEIQAPVKTWDSTDNGSYRVVLKANEIADTANNVAAETDLGSFQVNFASSFIPVTNATGSKTGEAGVSIGTYFLLDLTAKAELQNDGSVFFRNGIKEFTADIFTGSDSFRIKFSSTDIKASEIKEEDFDVLDSLFGFDFNENDLSIGNDRTNSIKDGGFKYEATFRNPTSVKSTNGSLIPLDSATNEYIFSIDGKERRIAFSTDPISFVLFSPNPANAEDLVTFLDSLNYLALIPEPSDGGAFKAVTVAPKFVQDKLVETYGFSISSIVGEKPNVEVAGARGFSIDFQYP